jgi:GAF domain-containing protein
MQTFIRVTEIWLPNKDRSRLEFGDGLYGPLGDFRAVSERTSFVHDEGLPGKAWAARHPIILKDLQTSYFRRGEAAEAAGLTCAVALPVMAGDILLAVVVFLCGDDAEHVGAIELWQNDAAANAEMGLVDGYYGTADAFGWLSRNTKFTRGSGLPGLAWQAGLPVVLHDLGRAHSFLRWEDGSKVGMNKGMAIPYPEEGTGRTRVMTFVSAQGTPIARRFELWVLDGERDAMVLGGGDDAAAEAEGGGGAIVAAAPVARGEGLVGRAWSRCAPLVEAASEGAAGAAVAIPFFQGARVAAVIVWRF